MIITAAALAGITTGFNTLFNKAIDEAPTQWSTLAMRAPSSGKQETYAWLGAIPGMKKWLGDRVIENLKAHGYTIVNEPWEDTIEVDRDDIEDDTIGVYAPMVSELGRQAVVHRDELLFELIKSGFASLCYDGQYFFDTDHPMDDGSTQSNSGGGSGTAWYLLDLSRYMKPFIMQIRREPQFVAQDDPKANDAAFMRKKYRYGVDDRKNVGFGLWHLAYGSKQTLDADNYAAAREAMMSFKNDRGRPLNITPTHLLVPPSLETEAKEILMAERNAAGATNVHRGSAQLITSGWLS